MKVNKSIVLLSAVIGMSFIACRTKVGNSDNGNIESSSPLPLNPNEKIMSNNGIEYAIRYVDDSQDIVVKDSLFRYLFVIGQRTEQGKNVLEYQASGYELYGRRLNYYNIEIGNDIMLVACGDTLKPVETVYENNLGVIPENRIVAVFEKRKKSCDLQLIFNDRAFDNYLIKASFNDK